MEKSTIEQTLVLVKPDGVIRGLIGKIISRFEETGLKISGLKMVWPDKELAKKHYPLDEEWAKALFEKTKKSAEKENRTLEFKDHLDCGKAIQTWLIDFITESPVVAMVIEGPHAVEIVRKIVGHTEPKQAALGTIRGDFYSVESYATANPKARVLRNLIHASDSVENAKKEIPIWFTKKEIHDYKLPIEKYF